MLNLTCTCGETYHSEESHVGSSLLCRKCGTLIPIKRPASLLDGRSFEQSRGPSTFARRIGGSRSRKLVFSVFACVLVVVIASLIVLKAPRPKQSSRTSNQSTPPGEPVGTENQPRTRPERNPTKANDRPQQERQANRAAISAASRMEPAGLVDRGEPRLKKENPQLASAVEPSNPRRLPLGAAPFGPGVTSGHSTLFVKNGTDTDAMVRVIALGSTPQMVRNFYVPSSRSFTSKFVPPGNYVLRVALGRDWNDSERRFNFRQSFEETQPFEMAETTNVEPTSDGTVTHTRFERMSITLHKVLNGNFHSHPISEEEFWR